MALRFWVQLGIWGAVVQATPRVSYPINSQVPPVARASKLFDYSFSPSTFTSDYPMSYTLLSAPPWLSLDSDTRTLSGTPSESDIDTDPVIQITATDITGSITMNATLVVRAGTGPIIVVPLISQLPMFGAYSAPSSILYYPSTPFEIQFAADTFQENGSESGLSYYAITTDDTPMPSWIQFEGSSLTFMGQTPDYSSLVQPPQGFGFKLIASDIEGFSGTALSFNIVVGPHVLAFTNAYIAVTAIVGTEFSYSGLVGTLMLSGSTANLTDLDSISATTPDWLSFDNSTFEFKGTPPANANSTNVTVTATDIYGDVANATIVFNIPSTIFTSDFPEINATIGKLFTQNFSSFISDASDIDVAATFSPPTTWLSFDSKSLVLSGDVPSDSKPSTIEVSLNATSKSSGVTNTQSLTLDVVSAETTSSSTSPDTAHTSEAKSTATSSNSITSTRLSTGAITAAVVIPIALAFLALVLCLLCLRRKRKYNRPPTPNKGDISAPIGVVEVGPSGGKFLSERIRENQKRFSSAPEYNNEQHRYSKRYIHDALKRSETTSGMSGTDSSNKESRHSNTQARSLSVRETAPENSSWKSTQGGSIPTMRTRSRSSGNFIPRNFSRKHGAHSFALRRESRSFPLSLTGEADSGQPFTRLSGLSLYTGSLSDKPSGESLQKTPDTAYRQDQSGESQPTLPPRSSSRPVTQLIVGGLGRKESGAGHGKRESTSRYSGSKSSSGVQKRLSFGPPGHGIVRNSYLTVPSQGGSRLTKSSSWITVQAVDADSGVRKSNCSGASVSTDVLYPEDGESKTMKIVPPSPVFSSDGLSASHRPISRRPVGSSPFFASSSRTGPSRPISKKSPRSRRGYSNAGSPAVPTVSETNDALVAQIEGTLNQRTLEQQVAGALRTVSQYEYARNPGLGISYTTTQESTRQLSTYIDRFRQSMGRFRNSLQSFSDTSSRFHDASSPHSDGSYDDEDKYIAYERDYIDDQLRHSFSRSSWDGRSTRSIGRDSQGNIIEYDDEDSPQLAQAEARPSLNLAASPNPVSVIGMRWDEGPERRPVSVATPKRDLSVTASHLGADQESSPARGNAFL